jgi:hypothetical protein
MGIFDRFFRRRKSREVDFGADEINEIWHNITDDLPNRELAKFVEDAKDVFETAYVSHGEDSEAVIAAREEFEHVLSNYAIDISDFDWDSWRDWYEGA